VTTRNRGDSDAAIQPPPSTATPEENKDRLAEPYGSPEPYGPPAPPVKNETRSVVLVLGPGLARGYAFAGALRALHDGKIPISAILGTEMGGLIGALYAVEGKINHFEWALQRFREDTFLPKGGLFSGFFDNSGGASKLEHELERSFGIKDLSETKVPLRIAIQSKASSRAEVLERGKIAVVVRAAVAGAGLFPPVMFEGVEAMSASGARPFLVEEARELNLGAVVVIDVLNKGESEQVVELNGADMVIRPDMKGIGFLDFDKRTDAAFRGNVAVSLQIEEIRRLVVTSSGALKDGAP
jgi:NTE family protein